MITYSSVMIARADNLHNFRIYFSIGTTGGNIFGASLVLAGTLGFLTAWKIGWPLTSGWLIAAYTTTTVLILIPPFTFVRWEGKVKNLMAQAIEEDRLLPEQKAIMTGVKYRATAAIMYGLLVFIAYVMVFKPF